MLMSFIKCEQTQKLPIHSTPLSKLETSTDPNKKDIFTGNGSGWVPNGPVAKMHSFLVLQISPINWAIITTLIVIVGVVGMIIICLGMVNACFPKKLDYREPPPEEKPTDTRGLAIYFLKKFFEVFFFKLKKI
jgi:hypothetical protein